jgi:hypothetical protein
VTTKRIALALFAALAAGLAAPAGGDELRQSVSVEAGGRLEVDLAGGSVEIETHDEPRVSVEADARGFGAGSFDFELTSDGKNARLTGGPTGWMPFNFGGWSARVRARVPEEYSVHVRTGGGAIEIHDVVGEIDAGTSGGGIEVIEARGPVRLDTSGGPIRVEEVNGDVVARTSGGSVRVVEVDGRVEARTSGGRVEVLDASGPVLARTSGGSITLRFSASPEGDAETSGGSIEVEIPEDAELDLEATTSGGRVRIDSDLELRGRVDSGDVEGRLNGGGPLLRLHTSGGNIRLSAR